MPENTPGKSMILAVDDRQDNLFVLEQLIADGLPDCSVITATSAKEGLSMAASTHIDGALIDVQMPGMDGIEMCRRLKADAATRDMHVILVTAHGSGAQIRTEGLNAGADDFISKPIDNAELVARINAMLRIRHAENGLREMNERLDVLVKERTGALKQELAKRERAEETLSRQRRVIALNHRIANIFLTAPADEVFSDVLEVILEAVNSRFGFFGYIDDSGDLVCPASTRGVWDERLADDENIVFPRADWGTGLWGRSLMERRTLMATEGLQVPEGHFPLENALAVPIVDHDTLVGQIVVANKSGEYSNHDKLLLEGAAAQAAPILSALREKGRQRRKHEQLEEQYRQAQKMEAIGRLAGGVAHDFNNLLTVIFSYAGFIAEALRDGDPLKDDIQQIVLASQQAATLTRQLLAFSRKQVMEVKVLDLNEVVGELEKMLTRLIGEDIEFSTVLADDLGRVTADPGQIEQVLMNLAVNARDAMPRGGKLIIETANIELDEEYANRHPGTSSGRYVMLAMTDNGTGITAKVKEQIFEPFFTTKEKGQGTGLGLSTVYGIVKQSGGNIWVYSEPGKGTTFKVFLPRVETEKSVRQPKTLTRDLRGTETVLVVEDEQAVRNLTRRILVSAGYEVVAAASGGDALLECERRGSDFQLLVTDVVMPKMSGKALVDRLAKIYPDMRVLYMSGYTDNAIVHHGVLEEGTQFISKPFTARDLLERVRRVLDGD